MPPTPTEIDRGFDRVVAVDRWHRWAAAYTWWVGSTGEWSSDIHLFQRDGQAWQAIVVSGSHGENWSSWKPRVDEESHLRTGERGGQDAEEEDGTEVSLIALTGFAASGVEGVAVEQAGERRIVPVVHDLNAFIILGPARDRLLHALDSHHVPLGSPVTVRCGFDV